MALRRLPYGANYLNYEEMRELHEAFDEKIFFRYLREAESASDKLENLACSFFGSSHALAVTSCTQGLRLSLIATSPCAGDRVYIPVFSFVATAGAVLACGLIPVPVDVDEKFHMDLTKLPAEAQRAIIVHMDGFVGDIPVSTPYVIEDVAQSLGGRFPDGKYAGTKGISGVYSFHHAKVLTSGEGGLVVTNNKDFHAKARSYHDHGSSRKQGEYPTWSAESFFGENLLAGEAQSAIQLQQLRHTETITKGLDRGYAILREIVPDSNLYKVVERQDGDQKVSLRIMFASQDICDRAIAKLQAKALPFWTLNKYFLPDHPVLRDKQSIYADGFPWSLAHDRDELWSAERFPETRDRIRRAVSFPISPEITKDEQLIEAKAYVDILKDL